jgi:hypothetical protein
MHILSLSTLRAQLKRARKFSSATAAVNSTICSGLKKEASCPNTASETSAGVFVIPSAKRNTALSRRSKCGLSSNTERSCNCSSLMPASLPTAELISTQKGHPIICAARTEAIILKRCSTSFEPSIARPRPDAASKISGRYAISRFGLITRP